jgi:hypothetical protein
MWNDGEGPPWATGGEGRNWILALLPRQETVALGNEAFVEKCGYGSFQAGK